MAATALILSLLGSASATPMTIDQAVRLTLARAPEVAEAEAGRRAAEAQRTQADAAYLPRLELAGSYLFRWPKNKLPFNFPAFPGVGSISIPEVDDVHHVQGGLHLGYRLFDLSRGGRGDAAVFQVEVGKAAVRERQAAIAFKVRATFLAALFARDVKRLSEESLLVAEQEVKRAELNASVGTGTQVALAQARIRRANLRAQASKADSELLRYTQQVALFIGSKQPIEVTGDLAELARAGRGASPQHRNPTLLRLEASRSSLQALAKSQSLSFFPTLSLTAAADLNYPRNLELIFGPIFSAGAQISWTLFDGFQRSGAVDESNARAEQLSDAERATREEIERKLVELDAREKTGDANLASAEDQRSQNEVYLRVARAAIEAGTGTALEAHSAELGLDQANIAVEQAQLELALVHAERLFVHGVGEGSPPGANR